MSQTKVGFDQVNQPSPLWYRRLTNAVILSFVPMVTGIVQGVPMKDETRNLWMIGIVAVPFLMKGIGMLLGSDQQEYNPSNETIDQQTKNE